MSRTAFKATPDLRGKVKAMAENGVAQDNIATLIGCSAKTLRKHFRNELDQGLAKATAIIGGVLLSLVKAGNVAAQIFWQKTQGGMGRKAADEDADGDGPPTSSDDVVIVLSDNGRDPAMTARAEAVWNEAMALRKIREDRKKRDAQRYRAKPKPNGAPAPGKK